MMIRRIFGLFICVVVLASATLALAGGPVAPAPAAAAPCGPAYGRAGNPCAFWGDAPFPGLCGGVVALPFLVVGTILGGNPMGPCAPAPMPRYGCAPGPVAPVPYGRYGAAPGYPPTYANQGILGGLPGIDIASGLLSGITGGQGLL